MIFVCVITTYNYTKNIYITGNCLLTGSSFSTGRNKIQESRRRTRKAQFRIHNYTQLSHIAKP